MGERILRCGTEDEETGERILRSVQNDSMERLQENEPRYPLLGLSRHRMEVDGAGVTTLVAGAGCPLSCAYCINKSLLRQAPTFVTAAELYEKVKIDDLYFRATGGGLCFGGGESLLHADFYERLRPLCPGWRFTAETSLNVSRETFVRCVPLFDAFIVDVKTLDPVIYEGYTGKLPGPVLENLRLLLRAVGPERVHLRVPLIPGYNDEADQDKTEAALRELGLTKIERFPYVLR